MPLYEYGCVRCHTRREVYHGMAEKPVVRCNRFHLMRRELSTFHTPKDKRYEFTTTHWLPGTRISSKNQWQRLLKTHRMTDDLSLKEQQRRLACNFQEKTQQAHRRERAERVRQTLRRTFRDTPVNRETAQWKSLHRVLTKEGR